MIGVFLLTFFVKTQRWEACDVSSDGLTLAEFYKNESSLHQLMEPMLDVVSNIASRNNIDFKIQKINCEVCKCEDVDRFPMFRLIQDRQVVDSFFGFKSYDKLIKFLSQNSKIDPDLFHRTLSFKGEIVELEERDFYSGFDGPWLVLFYYENDKENDNLLKQVHDVFGGRVNIGKIKHDQSKYLMSRFQVKAYPMVFAIYNGLNIPFLDDLNIHNLIKFTHRLLEPTLRSITHPELLSLSQDNQEPIYVVLHQDEDKANETFFKYAHNFKFKVRMYKSRDPELFKHAQVYPSPEEPLQLLVYKNGSYYPYDGSISDETSIVEWIFHTHFPNVTSISNSSFHSIFNGIKPVFLLLTRNDLFIEQLEQFSKQTHLGKPYLHILFSSINLDEYMLFTASLLPNIDVPSFVVYNPLDKKFYYKKMVLTKSNFNQLAGETLRLFEGGRLRPYGEDRGHLFLYLGLLFGLMSLGACYYLRVKTRRLL